MFEWIIQKDFIKDNNQINTYKEYDNGVKFFAKIAFLNENFLENQVNLISDFFGFFIEDLESVTEKENIKNIFEKNLHKLNQSLNNFAEQIWSNNKFELRWIVWIIYQWLFISSMVGFSSMMIIRESKIYYELSNDIYNSKNIDNFSDIIEWNIIFNDIIVFFGFDHTKILDKKDISDTNQILSENDFNILDFMTQLIWSRMDINELVFLWIAENKINLSKKNINNVYNKSIISNILSFIVNQYNKHLHNTVVRYRYTVVVILLSTIVLFLWYHIIMDMFAENSNAPVITNADGIDETITIASLNKELDHFDKLDQNSTEKPIKYKEINEKVKYLKKEWFWPEDVARFEKILKNKYYAWFNVQYINNITDNINIQSIYNFTESEISVMAEPVSLEYEESFFVWWKKWSILWAIDDNVRWTSNTYNIDSEVKKCSIDNAKQWLYCITNDDKILHISKLWVFPAKIFQQDLSNLDSESYNSPGFVSNIYDLDTYNYVKDSLYVLSGDPQNISNNIYINRYRTNQWKSDEFMPWLWYKLAWDLWSGQDFQFRSFVLDNVNWSFIARSFADRKFYQLRRSAGSIDNTQNIRSITTEWWDITEDNYEDGIKIIAPETSKYIYIFDKKNQTFTIYSTQSPKTNQKFTYSYKMVYIARFKFDLSEQIIDISVPNNSSDKAYWYILTKKWLYQLWIYEMIKQYITE